jgi:hypothetical protein
VRRQLPILGAICFGISNQADQVNSLAKVPPNLSILEMMSSLSALT